MSTLHTWMALLWLSSECWPNSLTWKHEWKEAWARVARVAPEQLEHIIPLAMQWFSGEPLSHLFWGLFFLTGHPCRPPIDSMYSFLLLFCLSLKIKIFLTLPSFACHFHSMLALLPSPVLRVLVRIIFTFFRWFLLLFVIDFVLCSMRPSSLHLRQISPMQAPDAAVHILFWNSESTEHCTYEEFSIP